MATSRADFIDLQRAVLDKYFALAPNEEEIRHSFEALAIETHECIAGKVTLDGPFVPYPSAANFADYDREAKGLVSLDLRERWREWKEEYKQLIERQPALELRDLLNKISETHNASSWPVAWEGKIRDWVDSGDLGAAPFDDRYGVISPQVYEKLRHLRRRIGGWLYWNEAGRAVIFSAD